MDYLRGLNPPQSEAVGCTEGPLLILAGAGSGKTRVITHRIAHLIATIGVPAPAILAVTFTNKAAEEMRSRVQAMLAEDGIDATANVSTFHSFCVRLLRRDGDPLAQLRPGFTRRFSIYDDEDQLAIVKAAYRHMGLDEDFMKYRGVLSLISRSKSAKETPQDLYDKATELKMSRVAAIYDEYEKELRKANALDFDDLLLETVRLLYHDAATRDAYNERLKYIMIDEYQDTNRSQYELMRLLSKSHSNVCVVGDEDQSIYSWRGADIRNILDFERDYPHARVIRLEQNYRSTKNILEAASQVVSNNKERKGKWLWTDSGAGDLLTLYGGYDAENEALFIADTIDKVLRDHPDWRVAVLYRTNFQSRQIEEALRRYGRAYIVVGGFSFYQRAEVKDIVAYLKLVVSRADSISLLRTINNPARGIGKTTVEQIERYALERDLSLWSARERMIEEQQFPARAQSALAAFRNLIEELGAAVTAMPLHDALRFIADRTGYREMLEQEDTPQSRARLENLEELANAAAEAAERGETVEAFLDHAALVADADSVDAKAQISLLTIHNAKGLEFPMVFLAGMEDGLFPHSRSLDSEAMMEEERRLCYVGMTRAEKRLVITWARRRRRFGSGEYERSMQSRFIGEIPSQLMIDVGPGDEVPQIDLTAERWSVRQSARKNLYTGTTYNSVENVAQFFKERGMNFPVQTPAQAKPAAAQLPPRLGSSSLPKPPAPQAQKRLGTGTVVEHPKFGTGTILRREGEGEDAKLTISFPRYGLKKMVQKYAGLKKA